MARTLSCPGLAVIPASPRVSVSAVICVAPKVVCLPLLLVFCLARAVGSLSIFIMFIYYLFYLKFILDLMVIGHGLCKFAVGNLSRSTVQCNVTTFCWKFF